ncbi:FAD-binding oxidoreductase [Calycomorphotria hydatis]|uniref:Anaerobic glycerol-3-phosphate dehydrogenase subunit C n=1 Tax=Calycomorphotria hydatis TaxID=2528027 RepID=A0A517T875_9PLAN|nr:FAD-binding oxidoreductase [Calycomorphotria hydatis]QDT64583.1 Anaerobic glycerol-3-phosphate dehydrogenase subunit C [Calycomorphotria hydatis]
MDSRQLSILEDLGGELQGEVLCDPITLSIYATDAGPHEVMPLAVAFPRDAGDVERIAAYALEAELPLIARGAGSTPSGACLGKGLVIDFSRHMHRILSVDEETVTVEPGIVLENLNAELAEQGRCFAPLPKNAAATTIGGMISVNASGPHALRDGVTRDHVESMQLVLPGGRLCTTEKFQRPTNSPSATLGRLPKFLQQQPEPLSPEQVCAVELGEQLTDLTGKHRELIEHNQPERLLDGCGYFLRGFLSDPDHALNSLLVGSEGTLGLMTSAKLRTVPIPEHVVTLLYLLPELDSALEVISELDGAMIASCKLFDHRILSYARESDAWFAERIDSQYEVALLMELTSNEATRLTENVEHIKRTVRQQNPDAKLVGAVHQSEDTERERDKYWSLTKYQYPQTARSSSDLRPLSLLESISVPPEQIHSFIRAAQRLFQKHNYVGMLSANPLLGQILYRPLVPFLEQPNDHRLEEVVRDYYQIVVQHGGLISATHGDGISRTAFLRTQFGGLYQVFKQVKEIFDPHNLLNPGKIVSDDPHLTVRHLRKSPAAEELVSLQLNWTPEIAVASASCHGCGECRTQDPGQRMCPLNRIQPSEFAAPRSKANAMRQLRSGQIGAADLTSSAGRDLMRLCVNCKQCVVECPSQVDIPHLVIEARAAQVASEGMKWSDWMLSRSHQWSEIGVLFSFLFNPLMKRASTRWFVEKVFGVSRYRHLQPFARRSFLRSIPHRNRRLRLGEKQPRAAIYFVDQYVDHFEPDVGFATLELLEQMGIPVHVPTGQTVSGMSLVTLGDIDAARDLAERNVRVLAPFAREGYPIICTEPSAAICLQEDYPRLLDHPDVRVVAEQAIELGEFLSDTNFGEMLKERKPHIDLSFASHTPCHVRARGAGNAYNELLALIDGVEVTQIEAGCSGMAGTYGLAANNFRESIRMGWPLITTLRQTNYDFGISQCSGCRMQMEQGANRPAIHPVKILAAALGSNTNFGKLFRSDAQPVTLTEPEPS